MSRSWVLLRRVNPGLDNLENEDVVFADKPPVHQLAFKVGETFRNQRRLNQVCRYRCQVECIEFCHVTTGAISNFNDSLSQRDRIAAKL